jgi:hypothetical protein
MDDYPILHEDGPFCPWPPSITAWFVSLYPGHVPEFGDVIGKTPEDTRTKYDMLKSEGLVL